MATVNEQPQISRAAPILPYAWKPGQSGNLAGRPKGSRNKLSEDFIGALQEDFAEHGKAAIVECRKSDPTNYVKIVASLLPKEFVIERPAEGLSDAELAGALEFIRSKLVEIDQGQAGEGATIEGVAQPIADVSALPETA